jgi:hypothetical protein
LDIAGAKALKQRIGSNGTDEAPRASANVLVPEDAPPIYRWLGVARSTPEALPDLADDEPGLAATA